MSSVTYKGAAILGEAAMPDKGNDSPCTGASDLTWEDGVGEEWLEPPDPDGDHLVPP